LFVDSPSFHQTRERGVVQRNMRGSSELESWGTVPARRKRGQGFNIFFRARRKREEFVVKRDKETLSNGASSMRRERKGREKHDEKKEIRTKE